ncbi:hypothetical protein FHX14_002553 [Rhizobium sp. BK619]|nr:hypothetical protein [Rhizobium sp. BK619]
MDTLDITQTGDLTLHTGKGRGDHTGTWCRLAINVDVSKRTFDGDQSQHLRLSDVLRRYVDAGADKPLLEIEMGQVAQQRVDIADPAPSLCAWLKNGNHSLIELYAQEPPIWACVTNAGTKSATKAELEAPISR